MQNEEPQHYDAVIIGGAFCGAAFSLLLRRWLPTARVLVVERQERFGRKVGESTVELSSCFLHRVLGLYDLLSREHLPKHGLRYWFHADSDSRLPEMSEVGPDETPRLPSFQLDRSRLDESLLALAQQEGTGVLRPAKVTAVELDWPRHRLTLNTPEGERQVTTRWIVDGSGRHAFLARRLRLRSRVEEHPTAAAWGRWSGVADLDGPHVLGDDPRAVALPHISAARRLATNHFCGYGWWAWAIPLGGGQTSVGVVYDKRLFDWPADGPLKEKYRRFVSEHPGLRELLREARFEEDDFQAYSHLPYRTSRYADRGWALLGDAASFLDPFYSPGLDHASMCIYATASILEQDLSDKLDEEGLDAALELHNGEFLRSYERWLDALYVGKYELFGDAQLTGAAFLLDTALYYMGPVSLTYRRLEELRHPAFGADVPQATAAYRVMRFYNRRLQRLARFRRETGRYGRRNRDLRVLTAAPGLGTAATGMLMDGLKLYLGAELELLWARLRNPLRRFPDAAPEPVR